VDGQDGTADRVLARIASAAHGNVTRRELLAAGVSDEEIYGRAQSGLLHRQYPGVYRVGHTAPSVEAEYLAAVLACGDDGLLCGEAGGYLVDLIRRQEPPMPEVLARSQRRIEGIKVHRARAGTGTDRWVHRGVPVTTPARTLVDLAAVLSEYEGKACHEAGFRHKTTPAQIEAVLERRPAAKGSAALRRLIRGDHPIVISHIEELFVAGLQHDGLPLPRTNRAAGGRGVDCRWPEQRLTVELTAYLRRTLEDVRTLLRRPT
jgi:hypothetical protein